MTQGHLEEVGTAASLLYLFLCSVGDTAGLSFWSRARIDRILGLDDEVIQDAFAAIARGAGPCPLPWYAHPSPAC